MSARDEITSLLNQYSYTVDTGDFAGFTALFAHAEWSVEGTAPIRGSEAIMDGILSKIILYEDGTPRTRHCTTNIEVTIDEVAGTASSQRYVTVLQATDDFPLQPIFCGHYFDEFERADGRWRFTKTLVRRPFIGDMSRHLKNTDFVQP